MIQRLKIALAALIMLVLFLLVITAGTVATLIGLVVYIFRDSAWLRARITTFGRSLNAAAGVFFADTEGHETISSWAGRNYTAKYGNKYKNLPATLPDLVIPWQAKFVRWLTDLAEPDHVYKAVEEWTVEKGIPL